MSIPLKVIPFVCMHVGAASRGRPVIEVICMPLKIDVGEDGFNAVLKPYQIEAMKYLWASSSKGRSSKEIWDRYRMENLSVGPVSLTR
jgi:hypothetical protein